MITLFDNYNSFDRDEIIEEMLECYDCCEGDEPLTRENITDDEIWSWYAENESMAYTEAMSILNKIFDGYLIAYGSVGRWNGVYQGASIYKDFDEAWYDLTKDCDYFEITYSDGKINVKCSHHDGTNNYTFAPITDEGYEIYDDWSYDYEDNRTEQEVKALIIEEYTKYIDEDELY